MLIYPIHSFFALQRRIGYNRKIKNLISPIKISETFFRTNTHVRKFFLCASVFVFGAIFIFAAIGAFAPIGAGEAFAIGGVCPAGGTCAADCDCCAKQNVCGLIEYDTCQDSLGNNSSSPNFCSDSSAKFKCWASQNSNCISNPEDPSVFNFSCSLCVAPPPPEDLPATPACTVSWKSLSPANPVENTPVSVIVDIDDTGAGFSFVGYRIDQLVNTQCGPAGGWSSAINTHPVVGHYDFTFNAPAAGEHNLQFGVNTWEAGCAAEVAPVICGPVLTFTTQAATPVVQQPFSIGIGFENPLKATNITDLLNRLLNILLIISGSLVVLMIMWAAFLFVTSEGMPQKIQQAKDAVKWAVIGFLIVVSAKAIFNIIGTILPFS